MKKLIRLTESDLTNLVKNIISEIVLNEGNLSVDPFILSATDKGNIKITNKETDKSHVYSMEAWKNLHWWDCKVKDFPNGTKIKVTVMGQVYVITVDKSQIKSLLKTGFGKSQIEDTLVDGSNKQEVRFTKVY